LISGRGFEGAPSLAIEILSSSTTRVDRRIKMELYARHGVEHYWIVDPEARSIEAYSVMGQTYHLDATLEGDRSRALPPFLDLPLTPSDVWR
jgi:Uma2 family endonuclease